MRQYTNKNQSNGTIGIVIDPVCGMRKTKNEMKATSDFQGKIYYFCSQVDKDMFDSYPEYFVSKKGLN